MDLNYRSRTVDLCRSDDLKALKAAGIVSTERVAVFGIGLGHLAVQYARILGGSVIAVDVGDAKPELARELGAAHLVNASHVDPVAAIQGLGGADVPVPHACSCRHSLRSTVAGASSALLFQQADQEMPISIFETIIKGIPVIGSIFGTRQDLTEVFALHAAGHTKIIAESRTLDQVDEAMAQVLSGNALARLVFGY